MSSSERFIRLLSLLQTHRYWSGDELAQRLDVSLRTLRRDVERLRDLGYPVQADRGVGGGYQLAAGAALPPLVLDDDEAVALVVGLQSAAHAGVSSLAEASVRALTKVVPVLPARLRKQVQALATVTVPLGSGEPAPEFAEPDALVVFAQGCRDRERISFDYVDARGGATSRRVEPVNLVSVANRYYLVAFDLDRQDWRSFRVDRARDAKAQALRFTPRPIPGGDAAEFVRRGLRGSERHECSAVIHAPTGDVRRAIGRWFEVDELGAQACRVRADTNDLRWAAFALASTAAELSEVRPAALVQMLHEWSARLARATAD